MMYKKQWYLLYGTLLISLSTSLCGVPLFGTSFFSPRSQTTNAARELTGWHRFINVYDEPTPYGCMCVTPAYTHSVRENRISQALFNTDTLIISGSQIPNRGENDILADYFGLSPQFQSKVLLLPSIQNALLLFNGYVAFADDFYCTLQTAFVWTEWELELKETFLNSNNSTTPFPPQYMAEGAVQPPIHSFKQALQGNVMFGDVRQGMQFGIVNGARAAKAVADIQAALGWNIVNNEHGYVGLNLRLTIPTGTRPNGKFFFEPIAGNGRHYELGLGLLGRAVLWQIDTIQDLSLYVDTRITHLFSARQQRSFDLKNNGFGSRYILLKEFDMDGNYTRNLVPTINITTLPCDVRIDIQVDFVLMFAYINHGFTFDIGYEGWIRSKEKIDIERSITEKRYGLKGIQNVTMNNQPSSITQSTATLMGNNFTDQAMVADQNSPVFLAPNAADPRSAAAPLFITQKVFSYIGYTWQATPTINPFLGVGAEIEIEGINTRYSFDPDKTTLSQWGIWLKTGIAF